MHISRREILAALAATPLLGITFPAWGDDQNKFSLELANNAVVINGRPRFLIGGSVDYFRHPRETWRDRLLKTKRAGLNAAMCYIPWNYHEPEEGKFDFSGDRDLPHFLDLCKDLDLVMFLRAGPFTCGEWDAASYPAWLAAKGVTETRTNHGPTLEYIRRWYEVLIPKIAEHQVTRGGAVAFVQQENEYLFTGRPEVQEYQDFLIHSMRKLGIDVPITDCNGFNKQIRRPESFQTLNNFHLSTIQNLRKIQPGKPVLISEFYTEWTECFGEKEVIRPGADVLQQQTFDCLAAGGMPFYFMFAGGTNFSFWGSRTSPADYSFLLPRYYPQGPITEGGALTENYFAVKAATQVAASLEDILIGSVEKKPSIHLAGPIRATARGNDRGTLLFISADARRNRAGDKASVTIASGTKLEIPQAKITQLILPLDVHVDAKRKIDFSNAALVAVSPNAVVVCGDVGQAGIVSINGTIAEFKFPEEPQTIRAGGAAILAVPTELAARTWLVDGRIIIGPAYVGEQRDGKHECYCDDETKSVRVLAADGTINSIPAPKSDAKERTEIVLNGWNGNGFAEIHNRGSWRNIDGPKHLEELGAYYGYAWYRAGYKSDVARKSSLMFTDATDRVHVYQNGKHVGIFGRGEGASRDALPIDLAAGDNQFIFLCDNMGRSSEGNNLDLKGIGGPVHLDAKRAEIKWAMQATPSAPPTNSWRWQTYVGFNHPKDFSHALGEFAVEPGQTLVISIRDVPQFAWISVNGKPVAEFGGGLSIIDDTLFQTYVVDDVPAGNVKLEIVTAGDPLEKIEDHLFVTSCPKDQVLTDWGFRKWSEPTEQNKPAEGLPTLWKTRFPKPSLAGPIFLDTHELSKGQAYLNGHALGRYWDIGPQLYLYLPEPWFKDENELLIFDEEGKEPKDIRLTRDSKWPTRMVLA